ncbi:MAG: transglutaminase-like domain-containing protein [Candidatus Aenigmarchaeota archaeon]|nr:transglutaminase-like domain-containing protein [Candidatus Aenigmarchaeota archaeon]
MKIKFLTFLLAILFLTTSVNAIEFPKATNYLRVKFIESGEIEIIRYPNSLFKKAYVYVYIPQEDQRQSVQLLSVQPSTYELVKDKYGNTQVKLIFLEPNGNILFYRIETLVEVKAENPGGNISFVKETQLTKQTPQILSKALEVGENSLEGLAKLAIWVNSYVKYDKALERETKSAEWVFDNRKGVCDEFSILFISLTRAWKIPFRYVSGVAYSQEFERHAWVELLVDNKWTSFDPTWVQAGYLDATHIKVANLPDANFSEKIEVEGRNIAVNWVKPTNYEVEILEMRERPPVEIYAELLTEKIGEGYFLLEGNIAPKECLISTLSLTSCSLHGNNVFDIVDKRNLWLCENKKTYWTGKLAMELRKGYVYNCTLTLNTEFGAYANATITIDPAKKITSLKIFPKEIIAQPNTSFDILAETILENFYLLYLDKVEEIKGKRILTLKSPSSKGNYGIWLVSLDGSGDYSSLVVSEQKLVRILEVEAPKNFTQNSYYLVNITIKNIADKSLGGKLSIFFDENVLMENVAFNANEILRKSFNITFKDVGKKEIRIILDVGEDREVQFIEVNVLGKKAEFPPPFMVDLFRKLIEFVQNLIQTLSKALLS